MADRNLSPVEHVLAAALTAAGVSTTDTALLDGGVVDVERGGLIGGVGLGDVGHSQDDAEDGQ